MGQLEVGTVVALALEGGNEHDGLVDDAEKKFDGQQPVNTLSLSSEEDVLGYSIDVRVVNRVGAEVPVHRGGRVSDSGGDGLERGDDVL